MYPEVQLPSPNGSLGHTRGQVNCAMARSKALINAGMPVYFVWNRKSHISNGTAKSVGSHSVSNTRCHGISVDDCAKTENLYTPYEAVRGLGTGSRSDHAAHTDCKLFLYKRFIAGPSGGAGEKLFVFVCVCVLTFKLTIKQLQLRILYSHT